MNAFKFAQQYYKRLADGEDIQRVNADVFIDGERGINNIDLSLAFRDVGIDYTWAPKTITVTIPAPMTERPNDGEFYYHQDHYHKWNSDTADEKIFRKGPVWSTEKDRDDAIRILKGGGSEA